MVSSFKVNLYPMFNANALKVLTEPFSVRHYHVDVVSFVVRFVVAMGVACVVVFVVVF